MNFYANGTLDSAAALLLAAVLGLLFGFWLERAGFGSAKKLTAIFYFRDWAVLKVMFSAMAVAAVTLQGLSMAGLVDLDQLYVPDTRIAAQAVGGAVFGLGFVVGGYCPGTAAVALGSGRLDAFVFLLGAGLGSLAFAAVAPSLDGLRATGDCGTCSLVDLLGLDGMTGALGLLGVALLAFAMAHAVERRMRALPEEGAP